MYVSLRLVCFVSGVFGATAAAAAEGMHAVTLIWLPGNTGTWVEGFPVLRKLCL